MDNIEVLLDLLSSVSWCIKLSGEKRYPFLLVTQEYIKYLHWGSSVKNYKFICLKINKVKYFLWWKNVHTETLFSK